MKNSPALLEPDRAQIEMFVHAIFRHAGTNGFVAVRSFLEKKEEKPFRISYANLTGGLDFLVDVAEDDARRAAQNPEPVVFCPALAVFSVKRAREQDIAKGLVLSVECDTRAQEARTILENMLGPATIVVKSGGQWIDDDSKLHDKLHLHWRLARPAQDTAELTKLKRARDLAARIVGGDPSNKPVCHPIRWPGSWHRKEEPRACEIETLNASQEIDLGNAFAALQAAAPAQAAKGEAGRSALNTKADAALIGAALAAIPNDDAHWEAWNTIGMAAWRATGGGDDGLEAFDLWSRKSPKYNAEATRARWKHYRSSPPTEIGAGTLFFMADKASPGWRDALRKLYVFEPVVVRVSDVPMEQVNWLWPGRIARGAITIFAGHPGVSKSMATLDIVARITVIGQWPAGEGTAPSGSVVILTSEDNIANTIRPRLAAAGADVSRVHVIRGMQKSDGHRRGFDLNQDIAALENVIQNIGDVVLVVIDTVTAYMGKPGKVDTYRASDVRALLEPLQQMAERSNVAVLAVNHLTKSGSGEALMRFLGSVGMVAAGRAAYLVVRDPERPNRRLFLPVKNNLGGDRLGLAYSLVEKPTGDASVPYAWGIDWEQQYETVTANEALNSEKEDGRKSETAEVAKKIISEMMADGTVDARDVEQRMKRLGISQKSVRTAKAALGVQSRQLKGKWEWWLPGHEQMDLEDEI